MNLDDALSDLQARLTYQEDDVKHLNRTVMRQQQELEALKQEVARLREFFSELSSSPVSGLEDEPPPPHY